LHLFAFAFAFAFACARAECARFFHQGVSQKTPLKTGFLLTYGSGVLETS
jgi:hypothetical protein